MSLKSASIDAEKDGGRKAESATSRVAVAMPRKKKRPEMRKLLPEILALVRPRRRILGSALMLMGVGRVASFVLPLSAKFLIDRVMGDNKLGLLPWIIGAVLLATTIEGAASYGLTQLLSIAAERLIADLRVQVQRHIGRLSVAFYDANRTGTLVARIMSDVEGIRN